MRPLSVVVLLLGSQGFAIRPLRAQSGDGREGVLPPPIEARAAVLALTHSLRRDEPAKLAVKRLCLPRPVDVECSVPFHPEGPTLPETTIAALRESLEHRGVARDSAYYMTQRPLRLGDTVFVTTWVMRSARGHVVEEGLSDLDEYQIRLVFATDGNLRVASADLVSSAELRDVKKAPPKKPPANRNFAGAMLL